MQTPPVEEIKLLEYRTVDSIELANPSRNLIDTIYEMENVQEWMKDYRQDAFLRAWKSNTTADLNQKINELTKIFKCSAAVIARKALDNKRIDQKMHDKIVEEAIEAYRNMKKNKKSGGGNYYNTMGSRLDSCFVKALCCNISC